MYHSKLMQIYDLLENQYKRCPNKIGGFNKVKKIVFL